MPEGQETITPQVQPKIEIADSIKSERCPYNFEVDPEGVSQLLRATGIADQDIPGISIKFARTPDPEDGELGISEPLGIYKPSSKTIEIYTDELWRNSEVVRKTRKILSQRRALASPPEKSKVKNEFKDLSSGKRFSWYLTFAPEDRALAMAQKLREVSVSKKLEGSLGHEATHAADDTRGQLKESKLDKTKAYVATLFGTAGIGGLASLVSGLSQGHIDLNTSLVIAATTAAVATPFISKYTYYGLFNAPENRAKNFEKDLLKKPSQRFISFTAKK